MNAPRPTSPLELAECVCPTVPCPVHPRPTSSPEGNDSLKGISELAADVREASVWLPDAYLAQVTTALDALVARVTDLEAQVAALTQERDKQEADYFRAADRADNAEAALATTRQALALIPEKWQAVVAAATEAPA